MYMSSQFSTADPFLLKLLLKTIGNSDNETQLKKQAHRKRNTTLPETQQLEANTKIFPTVKIKIKKKKQKQKTLHAS